MVSPHYGAFRSRGDATLDFFSLNATASQEDGASQTEAQSGWGPSVALDSLHAGLPGGPLRLHGSRSCGGASVAPSRAT
jgi:hypothetical protein